MICYSETTPTVRPSDKRADVMPLISMADTLEVNISPELAGHLAETVKNIDIDKRLHPPKRSPILTP